MPALHHTNSTTPSHDNDQTSLRYYGNHQIYFAPETKTYYWQHDGTWTSGTELPTESRSARRAVPTSISTPIPVRTQRVGRQALQGQDDVDGKHERDER